MIKIKVKTDLAEFPIKATVAISPEDIKEYYAEESGHHTWIKLYNGRKYRTSVPFDELKEKIEIALLTKSDKVQSDEICKTQAEIENELKQRRFKKNNDNEGKN